MRSLPKLCQLEYRQSMSLGRQVKVIFGAADSGSRCIVVEIGKGKSNQIFVQSVFGDGAFGRFFLCHTQTSVAHSARSFINWRIQQSRGSLYSMSSLALANR